MGQNILFLRDTDADVLRDLKLCWEDSSIHLLAAWAGGYRQKQQQGSLFSGGAITFLEERARQLGLSCQKIEVSLGS